MSHIVFDFRKEETCVGTKRFSSEDTLIPRMGEMVDMEKEGNEVLYGKVEKVEHLLTRTPKEVWITVKVER